MTGFHPIFFIYIYSILEDTFYILKLFQKSIGVEIKIHGSGSECIDDIHEMKYFRAVQLVAYAAHQLVLCGLQEHPSIPENTC